MFAKSNKKCSMKLNRAEIAFIVFDCNIYSKPRIDLRLRFILVFYTNKCNLYVGMLVCRYENKN